VILKVTGKVAGVQYDRVGAIWFNGVEILRMTTPEPPSTHGKGIVWKVERDLTEYAGALFQQTGEVQVQIPNIINNVYTGVIYLSGQLWVYSGAAAAAAATNDTNTTNTTTTMKVTMASHVISLTNPPGQQNDAWSEMAISGNQSKIVSFVFPMSNTARRAHIDLYASGHACEEFWYTNPPDSIAKKYGMCGGGSTRILQLSIDGRVAGVQPPFPVIYTGGINPLLWRPQTGIYSFNIPPYFFDISPFLERLQDGKPHMFDVKVLGNSDKGQWNIDPVLVIFDDDDDNDDDIGEISDGGHHEKMIQLQFDSTPNDGKYQLAQNGPVVIISNSTEAFANGTSVSNITWVETLTSELVIENIVRGIPTTTTSKITSSITNSLLGENRQVTSSHLQTELSSSAYNRLQELDYPMTVHMENYDLKHSFLIWADIDIVLKHSVGPYNKSVVAELTSPFMYQDRILANATYSRSTDPNRTVVIQQGSSHQMTRVSQEDETLVCWNQDIAANQGFVTILKEFSGECHPILESFCTIFDTCSPRIETATTVRTQNDASFVTSNRDETDIPFLVRHPRFILRAEFSREKQEETESVS